jgi:hypothetical protein
MNPNAIAVLSCYSMMYEC